MIPKELNKMTVNWSLEAARKRELAEATMPGQAAGEAESGHFLIHACNYFTVPVKWSSWKTVREEFRRNLGRVS